MTDPYEEARAMKKLKRYIDMVGFVCDGQRGIPKRCPCGGEIKEDADPDPKYPTDFDTLPGRRYYTCKSYKDDGLHFRTPWVFAIEEEVVELIKKVADMTEEIEKLKRAINRP